MTPKEAREQEKKRKEQAEWDRYHEAMDEGWTLEQLETLHTHLELLEVAAPVLEGTIYQQHVALRQFVWDVTEQRGVDVCCLVKHVDIVHAVGHR